jgi:hypothetical protein
MAWEWVGPTATAAVGTAGIVFTWLTGKQARDDARAAAREAREQQRLENAYVGLLDMAERAGQWVQMVYPIVDTGQPLPEFPQYPEQAHTEALVKSFGSGELRALMEAWRDVVKETAATSGLIQWIEADPVRNRDIEENPRLKLEELRRQEREARDALSDQVTVELRHRA